MEEGLSFSEEEGGEVDVGREGWGEEPGGEGKGGETVTKLGKIN